MYSIKHKYERKWYSFFDSSFGTTKSILPIDYLEHPFSYLPEKLVLNEKENAFLTKLRNALSSTGVRNKGDFSKMLSLMRIKLSYSENGHILESFDKIVQQAKELGIKLPSSFFDFFSTSDYLSRIRWEETFLFYGDGIVPFPEAKGLFLVTLVTENQGCCNWYLIIDNEEPFKYYLVADSFEEFIVRVSQDLIELEKEWPYQRIL